MEELLQAAGSGDVERVDELLTETPVMVNASNDTGETALHAACYGKHLATVRLLLDKGAAIDALRADGHRRIHSALERHHHELSSSLAIASKIGDSNSSL